METQVLEPKTEVKQNIQLVKGAFSASEACDVINGLIDEKINFHKLQRLQMREGNEVCNTAVLDGRIEELLEEKRVAKEFIAQIRANGGKLQINGTLEISAIK